MSYYQGQMYRFQYIQLRKNDSRAIAIYTIMQPNMTDFQEHIGVIAIEYGPLISVVTIGAITAVGTQLQTGPTTKSLVPAGNVRSASHGKGEIGLSRQANRS
jgi:Flp pilus assembly pilin Flp